MTNVLYAQAGGVTAVINASAAGVIEAVKAHPQNYGRIFVGYNGIQGILQEAIEEITHWGDEELTALKNLPGGAFQACRFDLPEPSEDDTAYKQLLEMFIRLEIGVFFYNGGNGSMLTAKKVADYCRFQGYPVQCIGVPKTIDNDLALSHCSPGFGTVAKYMATSIMESGLDLESMHTGSTRFLAVETMGRHTGWITMAAGLVKEALPDFPIILLPAERPFHQEAFLAKVAEFQESHGWCVAAISEGLKRPDGQFMSIEQGSDHYDWIQLGGAGVTLAHLVKEKLGIKVHSSVPDYFQRSPRHLVSKTDWDMAYGAGVAAVQAALDGKHGVVPLIRKTSDAPFAWNYVTEDLLKVADLEQLVPDEFISPCGMDITQAGLDYLRPLIQGELPPPFKNGLPDYRPLKAFR